MDNNNLHSPPNDSWVCPNDRQLALRAKLNSGWSVKTTQHQTHSKGDLLSETEQRLILSVIERAQTVDKQEQKRIGDLVTRLQNIKKRALGNGASQCVLCGDEAGFWSTPNQPCCDCRMATCTKCGINIYSAQNDTLWLCKICAETREILKKSGAWFFKTVPLPPETKDDVISSRKASCAPNGGLDIETESTVRGGGRALPGQPPTRVYNTWSMYEGNKDESSSDEDDKGRQSGMLSRKSTASSKRTSSPPTDCAGGAPTAKTAVNGTVPKDTSNESFSEEVIKSPVSDYSETDTNFNLGNVEFSLMFDSMNHALHCGILRAKNLKAMDSDGLSDPYIKLHLLPGASKSTKLRTKTVHKTLNPEFKESLTYYGITDADMARRTLRLSVLDEDTFGHDFIGEVRVNLSKLKAHQTKHFNMYLHKQLPLEKDDDLQSVETGAYGKILLSLEYSSRKGALVIRIVRCANLPALDSNGLSDPFVKIQIKPDPAKRKFKTSIKWKNLNPEFNEEFIIDTPLNELTKRVVEVTVWDKDYGRTNDYIGGVQIGIGSKGDRLRHWCDMLKQPDVRHDRWHHLSHTVLGSVD